MNKPAIGPVYFCLEFVVSVQASSLASQLLQGNAIKCRSWLASEEAINHTTKPSGSSEALVQIINDHLGLIHPGSLAASLRCAGTAP
jgi:hypothetical protein